MSKNQDSGPNDSAGTMDGLFDTARSKGRARVDGEVHRQVQGLAGNELDQALGGGAARGRQRLDGDGNAATQQRSDLDDLFGASRGGQRVVQKPASDGFDPFAGAGARKRRDEGGGSSMDDFFGKKRR